MRQDKKQSKVGYPLSHPQKRIWYTEKLHPHLPVHTLGGMVRVQGKVKLDVLEAAIHLFIQKNDALRLNYQEEETVLQFVGEYEPQPLQVFDFRREPNAPDRCRQFMQTLFEKPFSIGQEPLSYFGLIQLSDEESGYFVKLHHLIADGWSISIMTEQIAQFYDTLLAGGSVHVGDEHAYQAFVDREHAYSLSERFEKDKRYWRDKFQSLPVITTLQKATDTTEGKRKVYSFNREDSTRIREFANQMKCSLNSLFVALVSLYLQRCTRQEEIVIGTPLLNRSGKVERKIFGMFTSTMPFRLAVPMEMDALDYVKYVNRELTSCFFHQKYPYDLLAQELELKKHGYESLFQICVNYYSTQLPFTIGGYPVTNEEFYNGHQLYSLQVIIREWATDERLTLELDYKIAEYTEDDVDQIADHLVRLLNQMIANPEVPLSNLNFLADEELALQLKAWNDTAASYPSQKTVVQLFEEQVKRSPQGVALESEGRMLTFQELHDQVNRLAQSLRNRGVGPGVIVALLADHSPEMIIGLLGVLKAGGAYLPIDPQLPSQRIEYLLSDSGADLLLRHTTRTDAISWSKEILELGDSSLYRNDGAILESVNQPDDLAYVIYTSGSTGNPKGVMVTHRGLVNYIWWAKDRYLTSPDEAFAFYSSVAFDLTVTSIFCPLIKGNRMVIYPHSDSEFVLSRIFSDGRSHVVKLTPAHLFLLQEIALPCTTVKRVIVGGEDLKVSMARGIHAKWNGQIEILNEYGPTETVVGCMIYQYDPETDVEGSVPIGHPISNVQLYVLDSYGKPIPIGTTGELFISGDSMARGYFNREELTQERFLPDPFQPGKMMYKTGDLVRYRPNGVMEYLGRADYQVKIHGYRIELGEIEQQLLSHPSVREAVVIDRIDTWGRKYLCAYLITETAFQEKELREELARRLPTYMIPSQIMQLEQFPLTSNGKVDRKQLPEPVIERMGAEEATTPRDEFDKLLVEVYEGVLGHSPLGLHDPFSQLGGDSIKAIQVSYRLHQRGIKIPVRDILLYDTIAELKASRDWNWEVERISQEPCTGELPLSPIISWFLSQHFRNADHWNQSLLLESKEKITLEEFEASLSALVHHHDCLRLNYSAKDGKLFYNERHLTSSVSVTRIDLSSLPQDEQERKMLEAMRACAASFNLEESLLFTGCLFECGPDKPQRLFLTAHHLVVDGVSWRILLEDLMSALSCVKRNEPIVLPEKTHSMQAWLQEVSAFYQSEQPIKEKAYWDMVSIPADKLPTDHDLGEDLVENSATSTRTLSAEVTSQLLTMANRMFNTVPQDLLVAALTRTLRDVFKRERLLLEMESHGRESSIHAMNVTRTVGWFTSMYPVLIETNSTNRTDHLKEVKEKLRQIPMGGLGFGWLHPHQLEAEEKSHVRFNYLGSVDNQPTDDLVLVGGNLTVDAGAGNHLTALLDVAALIRQGELQVSVTYSLQKYRKETMEKLLESFSNELEQLIDHCCRQEAPEFTPSDFEDVELTQKELDLLLG
ncbi:edeine non-ribosomal peptide synthetase EdeP [Brevibacillus fortis]|uniref:Non-ribosomal peptide synthetase n=1 Tax=Brevibacillus fortis TaxID=2126352 RepID=A0A2P7UW41_9BACL|nr:edeine non-ribosomal peptide synthetase EdeP [Brevibacillus fortis]PSJ91201.1 non-ribosomal peptide synthetase [Brevibacillus fortis]